jgi:hypothetical protein
MNIISVFENSFADVVDFVSERFFVDYHDPITGFGQVFEHVDIGKRGFFCVRKHEKAFDDRVYETANFKEIHVFGPD